MITADKVKNQIQSLIDTANEKTGNNDADLTSAVGSLVEGFGGADDLDSVLTQQESLINELKSVLQEKASGGEKHVHWLNYALSWSFRGMTLPEGSDVVIKPEVKINTNWGSMLRSTKGLKRYELDYDFGEDLFVTSYFADDAQDLEEVDFKGRTILLSSNCGQTFNLCGSLKRIKAVLDFTKITSVNLFFNGCWQLEEVRISEGSLFFSLSFVQSSLLSDDSIQSIIDGLADLTGQTTQTITFHPDVKAKLTEEQIATITSKNWTLA